MTFIPTTMHSIQRAADGAPDVMLWSDCPVPHPTADEVLIRVHAVGVNRADCLQRQGRYPPPAGTSPILGLECSGTVVACGDAVTQWRVDDAVCALMAGGAYAEYVAVPSGQCLPKPEILTWDEAAALPEAVTTVYANIFEAGALKPGEIAFIHGGSSGIGTTAIQMVRLYGAESIVTAGTAEKCAICEQLGAKRSINYKAEDYVEVVKSVTAGRGVDGVLDMLGGEALGRNLQVLADGGRHVSIATQQGRVAPLDLGLVMRKQLKITGSTLRARSVAEKSRLISEIRVKIWPWLADKRLKPVIDRVISIKNAAEAHKVMESGLHTGKIVLEVQPKT